MDLSPGRRAAVVVLLATVALVGVVVIVGMATGGGDDDAGGPASTTTEATTTTTAIATVEDLGAALGCEEVHPFDGALPLPHIEGSAFCSWDGRGQAAGLHITADAEAQAGLVRYFAEQSGGWTPNGCPGDSPDWAADRFLYAIVAGDGWVVTTRDPDLRDVAIARGGEEIPSSPESVPPASYFIDGPPCGVEPELSSG